MSRSGLPTIEIKVPFDPPDPPDLSVSRPEGPPRSGPPGLPGPSFLRPKAAAFRPA